MESVVRIIINDENATLSKALSKITSKIQIHSELQKAYKSIYNYSSDSDGIRHANKSKNTGKLDIEDARYMFISCSAFINYLIVKASKAGLLENI